MKQKKVYGRPEMRVVELRHKCCILTVSGDRQATMTVTYEEEEI